MSSEVRFMPRPLHHRANRPRYLSNRKLRGSQSRSRSFEEDKNLFPLTGNESRFLGHAAPTPNRYAAILACFCPYATSPFSYEYVRPVAAIAENTPSLYINY
jgi:hypothetical protein